MPKTNLLMTAGIILIRTGRRPAAKDHLYKHNHTDSVSELLCDCEGSPCETSIKGAPHLDEEERGSHHLSLIGPELQSLKTYQTHDLLASALAHI
jgi:hypothetical protein